MSSLPEPQSSRSNAFSTGVGGAIFLSRWLQAPLYIGLIVAQGVYVALFWKDLVDLVTDFGDLSEGEIMLAVLGLVDVVMIANLLIMVIIGGYETFVSRIKMDGHPDQPEWLSHVNPNVLKVKLAMSIIGISSVHLLKTFIEASERGIAEPGTKAAAILQHANAHHDAPILESQILWQTLIHLAFIVSAIALAYIDQVGARTQAIRDASEAAHPHDAA